MKPRKLNINQNKFFFRIILPSALTIGLFVVFNFGFIIPYFEVNQMNNKKQMIREIVFSSICIADELAAAAAMGDLTLEEAQQKAALTIGSMRYGVDNKDYLWITDLHPFMIRHPYRSELDGKDLTGFTDAHGKRMFVEFVQESRATGEAYVDYMWQWMDDSTRIVPKISFVMEYQPWGWLIGTGVYLEDIRNEIAGIKRLFILASLAIFALMTGLLTIIVRRNLRVEKQRTLAEQNLKESRERYRMLVEASTDGTLLFMDGNCIYANKKMKAMLSETDPSLVSYDLNEIIHPGRKDDSGLIRDFQHNRGNQLQLETILSVPGSEDREVLITISEVTFSDREGYIYVVKDMIRPKAIETESAMAQLAPAISESLSMGIFSASLRGKGRFTAFSNSLPAILGFQSAEELKRVSILDLIENLPERKEFLNYIIRHRKLDGYQLSIKKNQGGQVYMLIYAILQTDQVTGADRFSGLFVDNSHIQFQIREYRDTFLGARQMHLVMYHPVSDFIQAPVFCSPDTKAEEVVRLMRFYDTPMVVVGDAEDHPLGIVSGRELIHASAEGKLYKELTARQLMNPVLPWFDGTRALVVALDEIKRKNALCLLIGEKGSRLAGVLTRDSLIALWNQIIQPELRQQTMGRSMSQLSDGYRELPAEVKILLDAGLKSPAINSLVTNRSELVTEILVKRVLDEIGPPPAPFALIALGSEARKEQTLLTDQDNSLIYDDSMAGSQQAAAYFLKFGKRMNELLHLAGYDWCKGDVMAGNPRWNQPLSMWIKYFAGWIREANPQHIVDISVFFDFRTIYGDNALTSELKKSVKSMLNNTPAFFGYMALANLNYKLPVNIFGRLQADVSEDNAGTIHIKNASRILVNITRLYAVKHGLAEINTHERLKRLFETGVLPHQLYTDLIHAFDFLMTIQFRHQVFAAENRVQMDHNINLSMLTTIELQTLKAIFSIISSFQNRLKHDFGVTS